MAAVGCRPVYRDPVTSDLQQRAARGFAWASVGLATTQAVSFVTSVVASRQLGAALTGVVAAALTVLMYLEVVLDVGLGAALIHEQEDGHSRRVDVAYTLNLIVSLVAATAFQLLAGWLARLFQVEDVTVLRIVGSLLVIRGLRQIPDALLRRGLDFRRRVFGEMARNGVRLVTLVVFLAVGMGVRGVVWSIVAGEVVGAAIVIAAAGYRPHLAFDRRIATELGKFGASVLVTRFVGVFWLNGDYFVVGSRRSNQELGLYYTAFRLPELLLGSIYNLFSQVSFSTYAAANRAGRDKVRDGMLRASSVLCVVGFTISSGMALIAHDFVPLVFGDEFSGSSEPMVWICLTGGLLAITYASGDVYGAIGRPQIVAVFNLAFTPVLIGAFFAVVDHGIVAVAQVHFAVIAVVTLAKIEVTNRVVGTTWAQQLAALRGGAAALAGIVVCALPVRLVLEPGAVRLVAIVVAGVLGAAVATATLSRRTLVEIRSLVSSAVAG